jgi:hypothetical protein
LTAFLLIVDNQIYLNDGDFNKQANDQLIYLLLMDNCLIQVLKIFLSINPWTNQYNEHLHLLFVHIEKESIQDNILYIFINKHFKIQEFLYFGKLNVSVFRQ